MERTIFKSILALSAMLSIVSCEAFFPDKLPGALTFHFSGDAYLNTRTSSDLPDTNSFILTVTDSKGNELYHGAYGNSPEKIQVDPGSYTVSAVSVEFKTPKFSTPQYGDKQVVVVPKSTTCDVELICRQLNSGVKLNVAQNFLTSFPQGTLLLKNADGKLMYSYNEKRIAYFNPGAVSLILSNAGKDETLLTRTLESQEILVLNISAPDGPKTSSNGGISIQIDTTRYWSAEDFTIGQGGSDGSGKQAAYGVSEAMRHIGEEDVWVYGYIVGGDLRSSSASFAAPFKSRTNIVIAARASVTDKSSCLSVQLQKGNIRDALNLVDNPDILGTEVFLKGDIVEAYYGIPGIQNITEYEFK